MERRAEIVLNDMTKRYGETVALNGLSLSIFKGETFGLLGPNGAGKTTAINILCGLDRATGGSAAVGGMDVAESPAQIKRSIGVCSQSASVLYHLTGAENAELFGRLGGMGRSGSKKQTLALLGRMGLTADKDRRAGKYSEGMKKRLSLAMALMGDPPILFLDEPTTAMDTQSRHAVWDVIRELGKEGRTIVLTTHHIEEAELLCERVGIIDRGRLIGLGSPQELIAGYGKEDLEEVFIHLTGRSIREGAE